MESKASPSYKILQIILMSSQFKRDSVIDFPNLTIEQDTNIGISEVETTQENKFAVELNVNIKGKVGSVYVFEMITKMVGLFEKTGEHESLPEESFKKINAPAIIYPFAREHIYNVAAKGGVGNILLQPINFTTL